MQTYGPHPTPSSTNVYGTDHSFWVVSGAVIVMDSLNSIGSEDISYVFMNFLSEDSKPS